MSAQGLALPVRASRGRLVLASGEIKVKDDLGLALSDGDNGNPWNDDVGLDAPVFGLDTPANRGILLRRIRERFAVFQAEDRAKLKDVRFTSRGDGELVVEIDYLDLETDSEKETTAVFPRGV